MDSDYIGCLALQEKIHFGAGAATGLPFST
jgi:hypothetical protein